MSQLDSTNPQPVSPDFSFTRDGVSITDCLRELVADDPNVRRKAGERLQAMHHGLPSVHTHFETLDLAAYSAGSLGHTDRFNDAIRASVASPSFDLADFVRRLCAFRLALKADWRHRVETSRGREDERDAKFDRLAGPVVEAINNAGDDSAARDLGEKRFARIVRAYVCGSCKEIGTDADPLHGAESTGTSGMAAHIVFDALGPELLAAPEALHALLDDSGTAHHALAALERAGPDALEFAPRLLAELDRLPERQNCYGGRAFNAYEALGSIARGDAATVDALIARLDHPDRNVRTGAAMSLRAMDGDVAGRNRSIVERLMRPPASPDAGDWPDVITLASVGRDDPRVLALVAEQLRPRAPVIEAVPDFPDHKYDKVMCERGSAIEATRYLTAKPALIVPLLIDALDTFEEFDPDWGYSGPCARVAEAIARFGEAAADAALPLAGHLGKSEHGEFAQSIVNALAAIGPAAAQALPLLKAYRQQRADGETLSDLDAGPIDARDDPVGAVIQKIAGGSA